MSPELARAFLHLLRAVHRRVARELGAEVPPLLRDDEPMRHEGSRAASRDGRQAVAKKRKARGN